MSVSRRILFATAANWFSRGVTILLGLVLMPVLFHHLPKEELGVWLLLGQSWAALGILDLGFGVTLTRRIAFAKGKSGADPNSVLSKATLSDISDLVATAHRIYTVLSVLAFAVAFGLGVIYLRGLKLEHVSLPSVWIAWATLCFSQAVSVWATPWTCLLRGIGYIGWDAILSSVMNAVMLLVQIAVVVLGGGLIPLAVVAALSALGQRWLVFGFARRSRPELFRLCGEWNAATFFAMVPVALRAWLTVLGGTMVLQTDQFFIASAVSLNQLPAYRAAWLLILNLSMVGATFAFSSGVFISQLWQEGSVAAVKAVLNRALKIALFTICAGAAFMLAAGHAVFDLWLGPGNYIGYRILCVFLAYTFLNANAEIIANATRATEHEAFAVSSIAAGILKLLLATLLVSPLGLLGIALSSLIAQMLTNHWYMVWRGFARLGLKLRTQISEVYLPAAIVFSTATAASLIGKWISPYRTAVSACAISGVFCIAILATAFWRCVLNGGERGRILRRLGVRLSTI